MESAPRRSGHDCTDSLSPWFQSSCGSRREQPRAVAGTRSLPPSRAGLVGSLARSSALVMITNVYTGIFSYGLSGAPCHTPPAPLSRRAREAEVPPPPRPQQETGSDHQVFTPRCFSYLPVLLLPLLPLNYVCFINVFKCKLLFLIV